ncbi:unnamed protein product [Arabidopsis arenosa]|uniref:DUF4283 domain-containing protein n=1 Tax=Arabidopsis arenosa TaxID=38785 RepID=A0A8S2AEK5_ARAAE|nr:unnamed protein product [Arabidopsis arenosa]
MTEASSPPPPPIPPDPNLPLPSSISPAQFSFPLDVVMSDLPFSSLPSPANLTNHTIPSEKGVLGAAPSSIRDSSPVPISVSTGNSYNPASMPSVSDSGFNWTKNLTSSGKLPISSAPVSISAAGRPRVMVPNVVFERGAKLHEDFIVGIFYGKPPSYGKIWGVLNFLWGKDKRVTVHNLTKNAFLFYISSPTLRQRVLQHELWHVGSSPFFVTAWKSEFSYNPPSLERAPVWTSIKDIPFDLITPEGLSIICRPLGRAVDHKPFTSINSAEVKVIVDLTKPLPPVLELEREDGQVLLLQVTYPWLPPLCPLCSEIGHKASLCPTAPQSELHSSMLGKEKQSSKGPAEKFSSTSRVDKTQVWKPVPRGKALGDTNISVGLQASLVPVKEVPAASSKEFLSPSEVKSPIELKIKSSSGLSTPLSDHSQISISSPGSSPLLPNIISADSDVAQTNYVQSFELVTNTTLAPALISADLPPTTTSNRFDMLSMEEDASVLVDETSSLVLYGSSPSSSSSSTGMKTKRKRYDLLSPAQGGALSIQGGKRHTQ